MAHVIYSGPFRVITLKFNLFNSTGEAIQGEHARASNIVYNIPKAQPKAQYNNIERSHGAKGLFGVCGVPCKCPCV